MIINRIATALVLLFLVSAHSVNAENSSPYLGAVAINVKDLARATEFYQEVLGLTVKRSYNTDEMDENIMASAAGTGSSVVLVQYKHKKDVVTGATRLVFYASDAAAIVAASKKYDVEIVREPKTVPGTKVVMAMIRDLDGNAVEILQR